MSLAEVLQPKEQRKLLALDGGGIRGLIAVEALAAVEEHFRNLRGAMTCGSLTSSTTSRARARARSSRPACPSG